MFADDTVELVHIFIHHCKIHPTSKDNTLLIKYPLDCIKLIFTVKPKKSKDFLLNKLE